MRIRISLSGLVKHVKFVLYKLSGFSPELLTQSDNSTILQGKYLRDRAYEEERPIIADFHFDTSKHELLMTTNYTRVVAVDSIIMINPSFRIRRILSYRRPPEGQPLEEVVLVGFGVEQKS